MTREGIRNGSTCGGHSVEFGSNRRFALGGGIECAVVGLAPLLNDGAVRLWAFALAALVCTVGVLAPRALAPFRRAWLRVGVALHWVTNPILMRTLYFGLVTPFGLITQLLGKGGVSKTWRDPEVSTYWERRDNMPVSRMNRMF